MRAPARDIYYVYSNEKCMGGVCYECASLVFLILHYFCFILLP